MQSQNDTFAFYSRQVRITNAKVFCNIGNFYLFYFVNAIYSIFFFILQYYYFQLEPNDFYKKTNVKKLNLVLNSELYHEALKLIGSERTDYFSQIFYVARTFIIMDVLLT